MTLNDPESGPDRLKNIPEFDLSGMRSKTIRSKSMRSISMKRVRDFSRYREDINRNGMTGNTL